MINKDKYQGFKTLFNSGHFENLGYGAAFCEYFEIVDEKLGSENNPQKADKIIVNDYLEWD